MLLYLVVSHTSLCLFFFLFFFVFLILDCLNCPVFKFVDSSTCLILLLSSSSGLFSSLYFQLQN